MPPTNPHQPVQQTWTVYIPGEEEALSAVNTALLDNWFPDLTIDFQTLPMHAGLLPAGALAVHPGQWYLCLGHT